MEATDEAKLFRDNSRSRRAEYMTEYPVSAARYDVIALIRGIHWSMVDDANGDINHRVWKFENYVLRTLLVCDLTTPWIVEDQRVATYANKFRSGTVPPPIVWDAVSNVAIDGGHRIQAAKFAGVVKLPAYVGLSESVDPDWDDDDDLIC